MGDGTKAYLAVIDLRTKVLDGTATQDEREDFFALITRMAMEVATVAADIGIQHNIDITEEPGQSLAVGIEKLFAIGMGVPGPITESILSEGA